MTKLHDLIGVEHRLESIGGALCEFVAERRPAIVGAYHLACSDETERECAESFHRWFAGRMLPDLKPANRAVFRTVNLGARYESSAIRVAEEHYAPPVPPGAIKLLVAKINSHVAVRDTPEGPEYGWMTRYDCESACCGALAALLDGDLELPAVRELAQTFAHDGRNRLGDLCDVDRVPVEHRALLAAVVNARLQAQRAAHDIEEHRPHTPTIFLVVPCVTINRPGPDTEVVVGQYEIDWTGDSPKAEYRGLGDQPSAYRVTHERRRIVLTDG